eukprot:5561905-Prymnesium_polylepis.1
MCASRVANGERLGAARVCDSQVAPTIEETITTHAKTRLYLKFRQSKVRPLVCGDCGGCLRSEWGA